VGRRRAPGLHALSQRGGGWLEATASQAGIGGTIGALASTPAVEGAEDALAARSPVLAELVAARRAAREGASARMPDADEALEASIGRRLAQQVSAAAAFARQDRGVSRDGSFSAFMDGMSAMVRTLFGLRAEESEAEGDTDGATRRGGRHLTPMERRRAALAAEDAREDARRSRDTLERVLQAGSGSGSAYGDGWMFNGEDGEGEEPPCNGVGVPLQEESTTFTCNGAPVSEALYDAILQAQADALADNLTATSPVPDGVADIAANISAALGVNVTALPGANATNATLPPILGIDCSRADFEQTLCACPLDYYGAFCERRMVSLCRLNNLDDSYRECIDTQTLATGPATDVQGYDTKIDGDPPCLAATSGGSVRLNFDVNCEFIAQRPYSPPEGAPTSNSPGAGPGTGAAAVLYRCNGTIITDAYLDAVLGPAEAALRRNESSGDPSLGEDPYWGLDCLEARFEYAIQANDNRFVYSDAVEIVLMTSPADFKRLSADAHDQSIVLSEAQLLEGEQIPIDISMAGLGDSYKVGGRVFVEIYLRWGADLPADAATRSVITERAESVASVLIDLSDYVEPEYDSSADPADVALAVILTIVVLAFGFFLYWWYFRRPEVLNDEGKNKRD